MELRHVQRAADCTPRPCKAAERAARQSRAQAPRAAAWLKRPGAQHCKHLRTHVRERTRSRAFAAAMRSKSGHAHRACGPRARTWCSGPPARRRPATAKPFFERLPTRGRRTDGAADSARAGAQAVYATAPNFKASGRRVAQWQASKVPPWTSSVDMPPQQGWVG